MHKTPPKTALPNKQIYYPWNCCWGFESLHFVAYFTISSVTLAMYANIVGTGVYINT